MPIFNQIPVVAGSLRPQRCHAGVGVHGERIDVISSDGILEAKDVVPIGPIGLGRCYRLTSSG
jgi:hypothetical protein